MHMSSSLKTILALIMREKENSICNWKERIIIMDVKYISISMPPPSEAYQLKIIIAEEYIYLHLF